MGNYLGEKGVISEKERTQGKCGGTLNTRMCELLHLVPKAYYRLSHRKMRREDRGLELGGE